jgi:DNA-binding transcriptional ArsR family regulator
MFTVTNVVGSRPAKDALFDSFARVAASLASGRRLEILDVLAQAPRSVEEIASAIDQSVANTSHHLRRLADDGLIRFRRDGRHVYYELASDDVYFLWRALQGVAGSHHERLDDRAEAYLGDRTQIETVDHETLRRRLKMGDDLVVIDVRPESEYRAGHIDGAISTPPERLGQILPSLPGGADVVAYCRGEYCAYADQAVRLLRASGRTAYRLEAGYRDWADAAR